MIAAFTTGREGMAELTRDMYEKRYHKATDRQYFQKVRGEFTKNHRKDSVSTHSET